eukprot:Blabericola_migrator_1__6728@NODE_33_length_18162_cov_161_418900_g29_i0_p14_GENE_NODE_33_length_18162_cov_161_418900_g29_i0NODE_33_length_18162_cov_161_418900_g29_i0_p14_ORF_typecomplete_len134_score16_40_NODE_33_length_18162_cov_161_418900_g29_i0962610027
MKGQTGVETFKGKKAAQMQQPNLNSNSRVDSLVQAVDILGGVSVFSSMSGEPPGEITGKDRLRYAMGPRCGFFWFLPLNPKEDYMVKDLSEIDLLCMNNALYVPSGCTGPVSHVVAVTPPVDGAPLVSPKRRT